MIDRSLDLRRFLGERRARIRPEAIGLIARGRRRVPGLRREEVAELCGVSVAWYTRFETGRARLSIAALQRLADVLLLSPAERRRLLELARPDVVAIDERAVADAFAGIGTASATLRDLARSSAAASTLAELGDCATNAALDLMGGRGLTYMRRYDERLRELAVVSVAGPRAEALLGHRQPCASVTYAMAHFVDGRPFAEYDLRVSPCLALRSRVDRVGVFAYHSQPVMTRGGLDVVLGIAFHEPGKPQPWQIGALEAAAAIVELALESRPPLAS